jgi:hypothetical protein
MSQSICKYCYGVGHTESKCQLKRHQQRIMENGGRMSGVVCPNCQLCGHIAKSCQLQPRSARQIIYALQVRLKRRKEKARKVEYKDAFVTTECPACWEKLQPRTAVVLRCKHMMCKCCRPKVNTCPLCRAQI